MTYDTTRYAAFVQDEWKPRPNLALNLNVLDTTNYDINSIDTAEFLSGPTPANPNLPFVRNPNFGRARATLPGREIQLGLRWVF